MSALPMSYVIEASTGPHCFNHGGVTNCSYYIYLVGRPGIEPGTP
jgi:hypothetical protein